MYDRIRAKMLSAIIVDGKWFSRRAKLDDKGNVTPVSKKKKKKVRYHGNCVNLPFQLCQSVRVSVSRADFDLRAQKCVAWVIAILFVEWFISARSLLTPRCVTSCCNKYLNLTEHTGRIQSAHFVRYRYVRGEFATRMENSGETRLKLGTKCRANLFLRGEQARLRWWREHLGCPGCEVWNVWSLPNNHVTSTFMISTCFHLNHVAVSGLPERHGGCSRSQISLPRIIFRRFFFTRERETLFTTVVALSSLKVAIWFLFCFFFCFRFDTLHTRVFDIVSIIRRKTIIVSWAEILGRE